MVFKKSIHVCNLILFIRIKTYGRVKQQTSHHTERFLLLQENEVLLQYYDIASSRVLFNRDKIWKKNHSIK